MGENKLLVFDRKEIFLIFFLVLVMVVTSFTLGIRMGKGLSFEKQGITPEESSLEELSSQDETAANEILQRKRSGDAQTGVEVEQNTYERLKKEFENLSDEKDNMQSSQSEKKIETDSADPGVQRDDISKYRGKFTIQLGAYRALKDARSFAAGFKVRGYDPIINEVEIDGSGIWYRVSLGLFSNRKEAEAYVEKEQTLFEGQEYHVKKIQ